MNPYVFIVGCPRSGTTLLSRMGDAHRDLAIIRELHWLPRWWERRVGLSEDGMLTPKLIARLVSHKRFPRLQVDAEDVSRLVEDGQPKHYARFVSELFDLHGQAKGKPLVGEKTPAYACFLPTLHLLWPYARVVHLIRDGRDVALSLFDFSRSDRAAGQFPTWGEDRVTTAALFWEWHVRLAREARDSLGPDKYYELRYEFLVSDPEGECVTLCDFLGVAYDPAMLRFHEGEVRSRKPGPRLPVTRGLRQWREQMEPGDVTRFEAAAGMLLDELGHELGSSSISAKALTHAATLRDAFVRHARSRGMPIPGAWERVTA